MKEKITGFVRKHKKLTKALGLIILVLIIWLPTLSRYYTRTVIAEIPPTDLNWAYSAQKDAGIYWCDKGMYFIPVANKISINLRSKCFMENGSVNLNMPAEITIDSLYIKKLDEDSIVWSCAGSYDSKSSLKAVKNIDVEKGKKYIIGIRTNNFNGQSVGVVMNVKPVKLND